jgi:hypothetical protein
MVVLLHWNYKPSFYSLTGGDRCEYTQQLVHIWTPCCCCLILVGLTVRHDLKLSWWPYTMKSCQAMRHVSVELICSVWETVSTSIIMGLACRDKMEAVSMVTPYWCGSCSEKLSPPPSSWGWHVVTRWRQSLWWPHIDVAAVLRNCLHLHHHGVGMLWQDGDSLYDNSILMWQLFWETVSTSIIMGLACRDKMETVSMVAPYWCGSCSEKASLQAHVGQQVKCSSSVNPLDCCGFVPCSGISILVSKDYLLGALTGGKAAKLWNWSLISIQ